MAQVCDPGLLFQAELLHAQHGSTRGRAASATPDGVHKRRRAGRRALFAGCRGGEEVGDSKRGRWPGRGEKSGLLIYGSTGE